MNVIVVHRKLYDEKIIHKIYKAKVTELSTESLKLLAASEKGKMVAEFPEFESAKFTATLETVEETDRFTHV